MAKNRKQDGRVLTLTVPVGTKSGDPVQVGQIHGVALMDRESDGKANVETNGVFALSVKAVDDAGNSAIAVGDHVYYVDADTPKLSKKNSGSFYGFALKAVTAGSTATIDVLVIQGPGPGTADILANAVGTAELKDDAVTKAKLAGGFLKSAVLAGGAAGDHVIAAIAVGDELVSVTRFDVNAGNVVGVSDITSEFTVAAGKITNVGGTDTTGDTLQVLYIDLT